MDYCIKWIIILGDKMRLSLFNENNRVLLLGEGNFSFSLGLQKHNLNIKLTSSCYESSPINNTAIENIKSLESHGLYCKTKNSIDLLIILKKK